MYNKTYNNNILISFLTAHLIHLTIFMNWTNTSDYDYDDYDYDYSGSDMFGYAKDGGKIEEF